MPLRLGIFGSTVINTASAFLQPNELRLDLDRTSLDVAITSASRRRLPTKRSYATTTPPRTAQADKFMALAKESETFDEYSIEKRGSCVRLEKQIGQFQCSFCSEETDFYDVRFEDTHWSVVPRQNMSPSGRRMTAEEVEEMERLQAAVTHLKVSAVWKSVRSPHAIDATQVKFDLINKGQVSKAKSMRNASL